MRNFRLNICTRLAIVFLALFLIVGIAFLILANWSNNRYYQEVSQNLNKNLAMYITQREPLIVNNQVNRSAINELAELVMVINPIVEVYVLNNSGTIIAHALPSESIIKNTVDLKPIQSWLANKKRYPIIGDNPRAPDHKRVFSVSPIFDNKKQVGYLYIVLGGENFKNLSAALLNSYIVQLSFAGLAAIIIFALASAMLIFSVLTKPLRQLANDMNQFQHAEFKSPILGKHNGDEIQYLKQAFNAMRERIREQLEKSQETDRLRRELISNVSHDLRTPLASMQGYLEMLILKSTPEHERTKYIDIAFKHCRRLTQLVKELFELSKLDAGRMHPNWEQFSLAELLQDVAQNFALKAAQSEITLSISQSSTPFIVSADIALIDRVLGNLIDNALRYTPAGGQVTISLRQQVESVEVSISDTGIGVPIEELPHIFDRYYRAKKLPIHSNESVEHGGTGLGLAIVKRILELHGSLIMVESKPNQGTCFRFPLPLKALAHVA